MGKIERSLGKRTSAGLLDRVVGLPVDAMERALLDRRPYQTSQAVLREVIGALGGWRAAVFPRSGVVNLDVDIAPWNPTDQVRGIPAIIFWHSRKV